MHGEVSLPKRCWNRARTDACGLPQCRPQTGKRTGEKAKRKIPVVFFFTSEPVCGSRCIQVVQSKGVFVGMVFRTMRSSIERHDGQKQVHYVSHSLSLSRQCVLQSPPRSRAREQKSRSRESVGGAVSSVFFKNIGETQEKRSRLLRNPCGVRRLPVVAAFHLAQGISKPKGPGAARSASSRSCALCCTA